MLDALLLIQDVQLLCFAVIFGFITFQYPQDLVRRWLWLSFMVNGIGAVIDFSAPHLPLWLSRGVGPEIIPLSYAFVHVAVVHFLRRFYRTYLLSAAVILCTLPFMLLWANKADPTLGDGLSDFAIGLQTLLIAIVLLCSRERSTRSPRSALSAFFFPFAGIELFRAFVTFGLHVQPDVWSHKLEITSSVAYIVSISVLPLAFLWMINTRLEADLVEQNSLDPLTQVLNRRGLRQAMDRELLSFAESGRPLSIAILDLDYFKTLNDQHGHAAGDVMLVAVANLLKRLLRETDTVARMGGEEFLLLMPRTNPTAAAALLERLRLEIENITEDSEKGLIRTTGSFGGTSTRRQSFANANDLLREADRALYRAKAEGRNRVCFYSAEDARNEAVTFMANV